MNSPKDTQAYEERQNDTGNKTDVEVEVENIEFYKIIKDFIADILTSFPEYKETLHPGFIDILQEDYTTENAREIYTYCKTVYPERFFDILYQNEDLFKNEEHTTILLPNIDFSYIWRQDISDHTKGVIWKYLQLTLFSLISDVKDSSAFGDTAKLFEAINEEEFKSKLEETLEGMSSFFDTHMRSDGGDGGDGGDNNGDGGTQGYSNNATNNVDASHINLENLPNPEEIHNHINGMLGGKLGNLAREIAEETAQELNIDMEGASSIQDVFKKLFKNPGKLMSIVKNVGNKLESKIKSGEISESDLMKETTDMMSKMKDMPGMGNIQKMMREMGMNMPNMGGGKNSKINMGALQSFMNSNMKTANTRDRMRQKLEARKMMQGGVNVNVNVNDNDNDNGNRQGHKTNNVRETVIYSKGDAPERSTRGQRPRMEETGLQQETQHYENAHYEDSQQDDMKKIEKTNITKNDDKKKKNKKKKSKK